MKSDFIWSFLEKTANCERFVMLKGAESFGVISGIMGKNIKETQNGLLRCEKKTNMNMKGDWEKAITKENVLKQCRKIPNWKVPSTDAIWGDWPKKLKICMTQLLDR